MSDQNRGDPQNRLSAEFGTKNENMDKGRYMLGKPNDRVSATTKASSSQSGMRTANRNCSNTHDGYSSNEALCVYSTQLTEFEKIEIGMIERIYTIGTIRRMNSYSVANNEGNYVVH